VGLRVRLSVCGRTVAFAVAAMGRGMPLELGTAAMR
jgi:hypothetical protein